MRDWKMRLPPRKHLPPDASDAMKADDAFARACDEDRANESALLAEAIGEITKIVLSFDDAERYIIAQALVVLGPEPEEEPERDPVLEALEAVKQMALAYIASQQEARTQAPPRPKRVVRAPANVVVELTEEELKHLAEKFGVQYVQAAIEEINRLRGQPPSEHRDDEKPEGTYDKAL